VAFSRTATVLASAGRHDESIAAYRRAMAIAPTEPSILEGLALVLAASGNEAEASVAAHQAIGIDPDAPWSHVVLCEEAMLRGDGTTALAEAEHAVRVVPHAATAEMDHADALAMLHRDAEAIAAFRHAIQLTDETHQIGLPADRIAAVRLAVANNRLPPPRFERAQAQPAATGQTVHNTGLAGLLSGPDPLAGPLGD
jgi:tetratricopeptide (TPR) repeat protein